MTGEDQDQQEEEFGGPMSLQTAVSLPVARRGRRQGRAHLLIHVVLFVISVIFRDPAGVDRLGLILDGELHRDPWLFANTARLHALCLPVHPAESEPDSSGLWGDDGGDRGGQQCEFVGDGLAGLPALSTRLSTAKAAIILCVFHVVVQRRVGARSIFW